MLSLPVPDGQTNERNRHEHHRDRTTAAAPLEVDDAAEAASLFRYASDPEIGLRCGWPPHTSVEGSMHDIRNILAVENNWAITIKGGAPNSNAPVAASRSCPSATTPPDAVASDPELTKRYGKYLGDNALEVGYWIGRPFWGKGIHARSIDRRARLRLRHAAQGRGMGAATSPRTRNPSEFRPSAACTSSPSRNRITTRSSTVIMTASTASSPRANGAMPNTGRWRG